MKKTIRILPVLLALAGILALAGCGQQSRSGVSKAVESAIQAGDVFTMSELLYYDGTSEAALNPDLRYKYTADGGITISDAMTGEALESFGGAQTVSVSLDKDKWDEKFPASLAPDLSEYSRCIEHTVSDKYKFYIMDSEIWLGVYTDGTLGAMFKLLKAE